MDYSYAPIFWVLHSVLTARRLLLGIDEESKRIACGLVDTIGMV